MSSHSFRYILSTHTHWWGLTNAAPYISKCLDILLIPATSHILFTNQFLDPAGAAAVELSAMPKVRGCRFWQNMVRKRWIWTVFTCKQWGFGELKTLITKWHGDIRDMIGLEGMAYRNWNEGITTTSADMVRDTICQENSGIPTTERLWSSGWF